jgi:hypothetical protein
MVDTATEWLFVVLTTMIVIVLAICAIPLLVFKIFMCIITGKFYDKAE